MKKKKLRPSLELRDRSSSFQKLFDQGLGRVVVILPSGRRKKIALNKDYATFMRLIADKAKIKDTEKYTVKNAITGRYLAEEDMSSFSFFPSVFVVHRPVVRAQTEIVALLSTVEGSTSKHVETTVANLRKVLEDDDTVCEEFVRIGGLKHLLEFLLSRWKTTAEAVLCDILVSVEKCLDRGGGEVIFDAEEVTVLLYNILKDSSRKNPSTSRATVSALLALKARTKQFRFSPIVSKLDPDYTELVERILRDDLQMNISALKMLSLLLRESKNDRKTVKHFITTIVDNQELWIKLEHLKGVAPSGVRMFQDIVLSAARIDSSRSVDVVRKQSSTEFLKIKQQMNQYAFGVKRGGCVLEACDCERFVSRPEKSTCGNCLHYPSKHKNLGSAKLDDVCEKFGFVFNPNLQSSFEGGKNKKARRNSFVLSAGRGCTIMQKDQITLTKLVSSGTSGVVYKGLYCGETVAVKVLFDQKNQDNSAFRKEIEVMAHMSSDASSHIVKLFGIVTTGNFAIVMEFCQFGSLHNVLLKRKNLNMKIVLNLLVGAAKGLSTLHKNDVVHRDVKSMNFLVTGDMECKIADLGLAVEATDSLSGFKGIGTLAYCAPENFNSSSLFSKESDVYAFGVVLWECMNTISCGGYKQPFEDVEVPFQIVGLVLEGKRPGSHGTRSMSDLKVPPAMSELIEQCWTEVAAKRPDIDNVLLCLEGLQEEEERKFSKRKDHMKKQPSKYNLGNGGGMDAEAANEVVALSKKLLASATFLENLKKNGEPEEVEAVERILFLAINGRK